MEREFELYHYGVPGMKWGVRRNIRVLANNRRNKKVKQITSDYKAKKITRSQKKTAIKKANTAKKEEITSMRSQIKNVKNKQEFKSVKQSIAKQTVAEVKFSNIKKGATTVNKLLHGVHNIGTITTAAIGIVSTPGLAPITIPFVGLDLALSRGEQALFQLGIDRLS